MPATPDEPKPEKPEKASTPDFELIEGRAPVERSGRFGKEVSVLAWVEDPQQRVLCVRQVAGKRLWSLPGGKVDMKESLEEGLRRETFEEIGLKISSLEFVAMFDRPEKASLAFLYRVVLQPGKMKFPKGEIETARYFSALPPGCTPSARYFWNTMQALRSDP